MNYIEDTIAAISTKLGESAINIVRMSGKQSLEIISKILNEDVLDLEPRKLYLRKIYDQLELIDQCLVTYFEENKSYNNEFIVEINTHGGIISAQKILELLIKNGARLASGGEFTKRAFLNGKLDFSEIEAINGIIKAKTNLQHKVSMNQYNGEFSNKINEIKDKLLDLIAAIEVNIDYPEYDESEDITKVFVTNKINVIEKELELILNRVKNGKILQEGINSTIIGKPNVGKSSLLNALTNQDSAIVTNIAGTTRDTIIEQIKIKDFLVNLTDTAGIRAKTNDIVEKIGIEKSIKSIQSSDFVFVVVDLSSKLTKEDYNILKLVENTPHIIIGNKMDISIKEKLNFDIIPISAKNLFNIEILEQKFVDYIFKGKISENEFYYVSSLEKQTYLNNCLKSIKDIKTNLELGNILLDFLIVDITNVYEQLSNVNNSNRDGEILDRLFSEYCLGK